MVNREAAALEDPVGESLRGHHAHLARRFGRAATYLPGVATFCVVPADPGPAEWADLSRLGVRDNGTLVAMAGERLRPPGWTEISAVCTAPEARGRGHAARLVGALVARVLARGERPFLHVAETNTGAITLYERLGFTTREPVTFRGFRTP